MRSHNELIIFFNTIIYSHGTQEMALLKWNWADKLQGMSVNHQETNKTELHPLHPKDGSFLLCLKRIVNIA